MPRRAAKCRPGPRWVALLGAPLLSALLWTAAAHGEEVSALAERIGVLREQPDLSDHTRGALLQAERALERADEARAQGDAEQAVRAGRIAEAALSLAERRLTQQRAQAELAYRERRARELEAETTRTRAALETEQARLNELRAAFEAQREATDAAIP